MSRLCKKILMFAGRRVASALVIGYADIVYILKALFDPTSLTALYARPWTKVARQARPVTCFA